MKLSRIFRAPQLPRDAAEFIAQHLADQSAKEFFAQPRFQSFIDKVKNGTWSDAAKEYREITGEDIKSSVIAAEVARRLL